MLHGTSNTCRQGCCCATSHKQALQGEGRNSSVLMSNSSAPMPERKINHRDIGMSRLEVQLNSKDTVDLQVVP
eukprot:jgi/Chrzof1/6150/Cz17g13090.t1